MKIKSILLIVTLLTASSCVSKDIARNLRRPYSDAEKVGVQNINFESLKAMKKGEACVYNFLFVVPILGNDSIMIAAKEGNISTANFVGETGYWSFPFSKNCTVVYGD